MELLKIYTKLNKKEEYIFWGKYIMWHGLEEKEKQTGKDKGSHKNTGGKDSITSVVIAKVFKLQRQNRTEIYLLLI